MKKKQKQCKHGVPKDNSHYCIECSTGKPRKCKNCKEYLMDDWGYCPICGFENK